MSKEDLKNSFDQLKTDIHAHAKPRVVGNEIVEADGAKRGMFETVENGEEHLAGHACAHLDRAWLEIEQMEGTS